MAYLRSRRPRLGVPRFALLCAALLAPCGAKAATLTTVASFNGTNGAYPELGTLLTDAAGNLYGTTLYGGTSNQGTVFELVKTGSSYGPVTTLASFTGAAGLYPASGLVADAAGNLFGTTTQGGPNNISAVFELPKTAGGYGPLTLLASFDYANGNDPLGTLLIDGSGNLFGTTYQNGSSTGGTVYEIAKTGSGYGGITTLANFTGADLSGPEGGLIMDGAGNLFGTTSGDDINSFGSVFEIANVGGSYGAVTTLATFSKASNGAYHPYGGLAFDSAGNLFGSTYAGGSSSSAGAVYKIAKTGSSYGPMSIVAAFNKTNGQNPMGSLLIDANGSIYGTTASGGPVFDGTVFKITKTGGTYGAITTLANFSGTNGNRPSAGLTYDSAGVLYGTSYSGGANNKGEVFAIGASGFAVPVVTAVPEPGSVLLLGGAVFGLAAVRRRGRAGV